MNRLVDGALWVGLGLGLIAAVAALYGRYRVLPSLFTGPNVCKREAGGCQVLFRTPAAALLGVPNALLGVIAYLALAIGVMRSLSPLALFVGASLAEAMTVYLARYLLVNRLECRICWAGHLANTLVWLALLERWLGR